MSRAEAGAAAAGGPGTFAFNSEDFRRIATMLHSDSGIHLDPSKQQLVYSRLARRLRALNVATFREYCDLVSAPEGEGERGEMLACLTTNVTRFFREPHHFEHLRTHVLPGAIAAARAGRRVRLWSAACSTGQEPYSLALTVLSAWPDAADFDVRILATDIDPVVLDQARAGTYSDAMVREIPPAFRGKFVVPNADGSATMAPPVQRLVAFRQLNLIGAWPMRERFCAIFCRNVAIYFDAPTQAALWDRFTPKLTDDGYLYIGHSERILSDRLMTDGLTTYRLAKRVA